MHLHRLETDRWRRWLLIAVHLVLAGRAVAQPIFCDAASLTGAGAVSGDWLGWAVATDGDTIAASAPQISNGGPGAVHVFRRAGAAWSNEAMLVAPEAASGDRFAWSVAVQGDVLVAGAPWTDGTTTDQGAVYVFRRAGVQWTQEARLTIPERGRLGNAVAIEGDTIIAGAPLAGGHYEGAAYVFRHDGAAWIQTARLTASDGVAAGLFGHAVDLDGERIIVGARGTCSGSYDAPGSAYVFRRTGESWSEEAILLPGGIGCGTGYGMAVALDGDRAIVGAPTQGGEAFVFRRDGTVWTAEATLPAPWPLDDLGFGRSVALSGERAAIGAWRDDHSGQDSGSVLVYRRDGSVWTLDSRMTAAGVAGSSRLGHSLAMTGTTIAAGAPTYAAAGYNQGAVFLLDAEACTPQCGGDLDASGGVGFNDFMILLSVWGACPGCIADLDDSETVDLLDLIELVGAWGPCS